MASSIRAEQEAIDIGGTMSVVSSVARSINDAAAGSSVRATGRPLSEPFEVAHVLDDAEHAKKARAPHVHRSASDLLGG